eukprot:m.60441 g.60441  ORF g.60441 m.60441 type:complete len:330 (-) comp7277_c0_seq1:90-1079(-)
MAIDRAVAMIGASGVGAELWAPLGEGEREAVTALAATAAAEGVCGGVCTLAVLAAPATRLPLRAFSAGAGPGPFVGVAAAAAAAAAGRLRLRTGSAAGSAAADAVRVRTGVAVMEPFVAERLTGTGCEVAASWRRRWRGVMLAAGVATLLPLRDDLALLGCAATPSVALDRRSASALFMRSLVRSSIDLLSEGCMWHWPTTLPRTLHGADAVGAAVVSSLAGLLGQWATHCRCFASEPMRNLMGVPLMVRTPSSPLGLNMMRMVPCAPGAASSSAASSVSRTCRISRCSASAVGASASAAPGAGLLFVAGSHMAARPAVCATMAPLRLC